MADSITVDRKNWLGHRWGRHGLVGGSGKNVMDGLLLLGFQDSRGGGAAQSLAQRAGRIGSTGVPKAIRPDGPLVSMWSVRGAPHAHRANQLDLVRDAHAPRESDDGGAGYVEAVQEVAAALAAVVTGPTPKATASAEVADRIASSLVRWCPRCEAHHVPDATFRAAGRQAQLVLGREEQRATILHPRPAHAQDPADRPRLALLEAFLRVNGPATRTLVRDWMEGGTESTAEAWRQLDGVVRVKVGDRRCELPEALLDEVRTAPAAEGVVLVPPNDPYLRQVDRTLLVPDAKRRQQMWKALSGPGALLVDGEVAGTWRHRRADRKLTITAFESVSRAQRAAAERSAASITAVSGDEEPTVSWS